MRIDYGPPGHRGVTQIMGLGADPVDIIVSVKTVSKTNRNVGLLALGTWIGGLLAGSNTAKNLGLGGLLAVGYIHVLNKKPEVVALPAIPPVDLQGWG